MASISAQDADSKCGAFDGNTQEKVRYAFGEQYHLNIKAKTVPDPRLLSAWTLRERIRQLHVDGGKCRRAQPLRTKYHRLYFVNKCSDNGASRKILNDVPRLRSYFLNNSSRNLLEVSRSHTDCGCPRSCTLSPFRASCEAVLAVPSPR